MIPFGHLILKLLLCGSLFLNTRDIFQMFARPDNVLGTQLSNRYILLQCCHAGPQTPAKKMLSLTAIAFIKHLTSRRGARSSCQPLIGPPPPHRPPPIIPSSARTSSKRISTSCQRCFRSSCQARCGGRRAAPDVNDGLIKAPCVFTQRVSARPLAGRARAGSVLLGGILSPCQQVYALRFKSQQSADRN